MVDYVFDSTNSFFNTGRAISDFTAGTVKVKADGHLISTGDFSVVGDLNWTITILGSIGTYAAAKAGIFLGSPGLAIASSLIISADGDLFGTNVGLYVQHRTNVVNAGSISATTGDGILETANAIGNYKITNSGIIVGGNNGMSLLGAGIHTTYFQEQTRTSITASQRQ